MTRASLETPTGAAAAAATRLCDHPGCASGGEYRAPRSRFALDTFFWFCLDHVRLFNAQWNYYAGMSAREIEAEIRNDTVWQRPTWPLGGRGGAGRGFEARAGHLGLSMGGWSRPDRTQGNGYWRKLPGHMGVDTLVQ